MYRLDCTDFLPIYRTDRLIDGDEVNVRHQYVHHTVFGLFLIPAFRIPIITPWELAVNTFN